MEKLVIKGHRIGEGRPLICVPIMQSSKEGIVCEAKRLAELRTDMIEWRVDAFENPLDQDAIREVLKEMEPVIGNTILVFTFRSKQQGGLVQPGQKEISDIHQLAAESGVADLIDVEYFSSRHPKKEIAELQRMGAHVIASHHDFIQTPRRDIIQTVLEQMNAGGADIIKLALMPRSTGDVLVLLEETNAFHEENPDRPVITMSMGPLGCISRVAGETFGSCITFGAGERMSAPGQLPMEDLKQVLDILHNGWNGGRDKC